jgi:hypothetical protein
MGYRSWGLLWIGRALSFANQVVLALPCQNIGPLPAKPTVCRSGQTYRVFKIFECANCSYFECAVLGFWARMLPRQGKSHRVYRHLALATLPCFSWLNRREMIGEKAVVESIPLRQQFAMSFVTFRISPAGSRCAHPPKRLTFESHSLDLLLRPESGG